MSEAAWKLVPVEPTEQMIEAGRHVKRMRLLGSVKAIREGRDPDELIGKTAGAEYRAMLEAAPVAVELSQPVAIVERKEVHGHVCVFIKRLPSNRDIPDGTKLYDRPIQLTNPETFIIYLDEDAIDVGQFYRAKGFEKLPPTPTMSGAEIRACGWKKNNYQMYIIPQDGATSIPVGDAQAIPLVDGMRFWCIPPATAGVSL